MPLPISRRSLLQTLAAAGVVGSSGTPDPGQSDHRMHPNTHHIKLNSDRPNFRLRIEDDHGHTPDLRDASNVQFLMYAADGTTHIDQPASVEAPAAGLVEYDFDESETSPAGSYRVELRVDWSDGDEQWYPVKHRGYRVVIVPPPHDRGDVYGQTTYGQTDYGTDL